MWYAHDNVSRPLASGLCIWLEIWTHFAAFIEVSLKTKELSVYFVEMPGVFRVFSQPIFNHLVGFFFWSALFAVPPPPNYIRLS